MKNIQNMFSIIEHHHDLLNADLCSSAAADVLGLHLAVTITISVAHMCTLSVLIVLMLDPKQMAISSEFNYDSVCPINFEA